MLNLIQEFMITIRINHLFGKINDLIYDPKYTNQNVINRIKLARDWECVDERNCYGKLFDSINKSSLTFFYLDDYFKYHFGQVYDTYILHYESTDIMSHSHRATLLNRTHMVDIYGDNIFINIQDTDVSLLQAVKCRDVILMRKALKNYTRRI